MAVVRLVALRGGVCPVARGLPPGPGASVTGDGRRETGLAGPGGV